MLSTSIGSSATVAICYTHRASSIEDGRGATRRATEKALGCRLHKRDVGPEVKHIHQVGAGGLELEVDALVDIIGGHALALPRIHSTSIPTHVLTVSDALLSPRALRTWNDEHRPHDPLHRWVTKVRLPPEARSTTFFERVEATGEDGGLLPVRPRRADRQSRRTLEGN
jgi:hypothetical protein